MKKLFFIAFTFTSVLFAQDTLTVMSYNLLNYPNISPTRYNDLKVITQYIKPDIFICSELTDSSGITLIMNNALNTGGITYYDHAAWADGPDTDNMLFYNTDKLTLASQNQIPTALRDISHYRLYSCEGIDTVWYDVFSCHLKASSGSTNANARLAEATLLTNYIGTLPANTNIIVGGDFNFYSASAGTEPAWNQLTVTCNPPLKDPLNMAGDWHANSFYKSIHTQSTRSTSNPGCCGGPTGGLDDRFDFLLVNQHLVDGTAGAQYMSGTYKAVGNDGNHFNISIVESPTNSSVPSAVNTALFNMSDHLPVIMKVYTCDITLGVENNPDANDIHVSFPQHDKLLIEVHFNKTEIVTAEVVDMQGAIVATAGFNAIEGQNQFHMELPHAHKGMYVLRLHTNAGVLVKKFVK